MNRLINPDLEGLAQQNWQNLTECTYFGRFIAVGISADGMHLHLATAMSGRSPGSKNRRYVHGFEPGTIKTEVVDPTLEVGDPELTLYETQMDMHGRRFAVSNGRQTRDALFFDATHPTLLGDVLSKYEHEPDKSIFTNRITARCILERNSSGVMSILFEFAVHSPTEYGTTLISTTKPEMLEYGFSLFLATYDGNGDPPIRFGGGPRLIPTSKIADINKLRVGLSTGNDFLVAASLKTVEIETGIVQPLEIWNRHGDKPA